MSAADGKEGEGDVEKSRRMLHLLMGGGCEGTFQGASDGKKGRGGETSDEAPDGQAPGTYLSLSFPPLSPVVNSPHPVLASHALSVLPGVGKWLLTRWSLSVLRWSVWFP